MLAAALAMERGWAINLGGGMVRSRPGPVGAGWDAWACCSCHAGLPPKRSESPSCGRPTPASPRPHATPARPSAPAQHHAYHDDGGGWCPFADINLAVRRLRAASGGTVRRVMVVDLDVHQASV